MEQKREKLGFNKYLVIPILLGFLVFGISFALFSETLFGEKEYTIKSGGLSIRLDESETSQNIYLEKVIPVSDEVGLENTPYIFSLVNEENDDLVYTIYLKEKTLENKTPSSAIRYNYIRDIESIDITRNIDEQKTEDGKYYLETGVIPAHNTYRYEFRMWIDLDAGNEILNTEYSISLEVETVQATSLYKEEILHGTDPVLTKNLIPVTIENDGTVKRASLYKKWYNYSKQEWANAVVLEDKTQKYNPGEIIPEENIESYFVWIPRYKYKIFNDETYTGVTALENRVQIIEVEFENKDTPISNGTMKDEWLSHPAFQAFDTNGFWVGKFETGYKDATTTATAQINSSDSAKIIVKPNVFSWRNITVGNAFKASYDYLRSEESHMMKNTEWGAVAYLQHSIYGSRGSVRINNNNAYKTGYASVSEPSGGAGSGGYGTDVNVTQFYNTIVGYSASTTANISGIYDMSGGTFEYVMGYNQNASSVGGSSGITGIYGDFFSNSEWDKYYDKYINSANSETAYQNRLLGDATGEMGPFGNVKDSDGTTRHRTSWYGDYAFFATSTQPWFLRGGPWNYGVESGVFAFGYYTGGAYTNVSFRLVLTP